MLLIYSEAAALQYEEAERLMDIALSAKEHADGLLIRCADLVVMGLLEIDEKSKETIPQDANDIPF